MLAFFMFGNPVPANNFPEKSPCLAIFAVLRIKQIIEY